MSQVSLFRKWRSKAFADLVGQESVVKTLRNVLAGGAPARAYLFCGPRGTGKTSTARIFAKALCCENGPGLEPCNDCSTCREIAQGNCMDVFEIDAASNTQVDKIRDFIVDKVHFAPAKARFKVYIIDEVHKLSSSSFNALLKTLEEPPSHVVFILATTHPHELLPTILSRCQRYDFRAFSLGELEKHLNKIAVEEGLELHPEALQLLARASQGSMRDALVLLEQAHHYSGAQVAVADVVQMLGLVPQETLGEWVQALGLSDAARLLTTVEQMHRGGQDFVRVVDLWVEHLRLLMLTKVQAHEAGLEELNESYRQALTAQSAQISLPQILAWLKESVDLQQSIREGQPARIALELCLVQLCAPKAATNLDALARQVQELQEKVRSLEVNPGPALTKAVEKPVPQQAPKPIPEARPQSVEKTIPKPVPQPAEKTPPPLPKPVEKPTAEARPQQAEKPKPAEPKPQEVVKAITQPKEFWPFLLQAVRQRDVRLQAVLAEAKLRDLSPELVRVSLPGGYQWHYEVIGKSISLLEEVSSQLLQSKVRFEVVLDGGQVSPPQEQEHETLVKKAHGLFGGRVLDAANESPIE